jgi:hypothetical protein
MASLTETVPVPEGINVKKDGTAVRSAKQATMFTLLGNPRSDLTDKCQPITNQALKLLMLTASVGPFRVTGLRPAVESLREVMQVVAEQHPAIHAALGTAGMLCVRHVRDNPGATSNHAWGTAVDLTLDRVLDKRGDGRVQVGLIPLAAVFVEHGWYWGAAFGTEDAMHFEASDGLIREWAGTGKFGKSPSPPNDGMLSRGDRGPDVAELQERLNAHGALLIVDSDFGKDTLAAVLAFQGRSGLPVTGIVDGETMKALMAGKAVTTMLPPSSPVGLKVKVGK